MALEGGALFPLQAGWGGTCPWCPPASATYVLIDSPVQLTKGLDFPLKTVDPPNNPPMIVHL